MKLNKFGYPLAFWSVFCTIFFLTVLNLEGFDYAIKILISIAFPIIIPVTLVSVGFDKLFLKKKYFWFIIELVIVVGFFGYCNTLWYKYMLGNQAYSGTYATIIFISTIFIGIKNIRINILQKQKFALLESKQFQTELQLLKSQINPHFLFNSLNFIGECINAMEALSFLHQHKVDILFLDIKMPDMTGLELLKTLSYKPIKKLPLKKCNADL